jgi:protease I
MKILIPMSDRDSDPTEVAIPWKQLTALGYEVQFPSPLGQIPEADRRMLSGRGLRPWRPFLRARKDARKAYSELEKDPHFQSPLPYKELNDRDFDGVLLPGGHGPGIKTYLESEELQQLVVEVTQAEKPLAAICHGVVLAARAVNPETGKSVLFGRKTTALPRAMEMSAWLLIGLWLGLSSRLDGLAIAIASQATFMNYFRRLRGRLKRIKRGSP